MLTKTGNPGSNRKMYARNIGQTLCSIMWPPMDSSWTCLNGPQLVSSPAHYGGVECYISRNEIILNMKLIRMGTYTIKKIKMVSKLPLSMSWVKIDCP